MTQKPDHGYEKHPKEIARPAKQEEHRKRLPGDTWEETAADADEPPQP